MLETNVTITKSNTRKQCRYRFESRPLCNYYIEIIKFSNHYLFSLWLSLIIACIVTELIKISLTSPTY